ncbi:insecticyanin-A-like [Cydia splendana]|uniref:insecticyanin-A-like n=1 Tax=Cydia splendana TaxID=1100963 RepID=UPI00214265DD
MLRILIFVSLLCHVFGYFTLPGKCPERVNLKEDFRLAEFYNDWYQTYSYSSDGHRHNNCSVLNLITKPTGIYLNQSRVDRGLFHRYSVGRMVIQSDIEKPAYLDIEFQFENAPRRLKTRRYPFRVLATNYNYYATVYTCEYSPLIDKHFIYVWVLSRSHLLNEVSLALATKPLQQIGVDPAKLVKEDWSKCQPKYYEDQATEPMTFRYPVPI